MSSDTYQPTPAAAEKMALLGRLPLDGPPALALARPMRAGIFRATVWRIATDRPVVPDEIDETVPADRIAQLREELLLQGAYEWELAAAFDCSRRKVQRLGLPHDKIGGTRIYDAPGAWNVLKRRSRKTDERQFELEFPDEAPRPARRSSSQMKTARHGEHGGPGKSQPKKGL